MAAATAARNGKQVLLMEKMEKAGRKIRISGKGRCNLTNARPPEEFREAIRVNADFSTWPSPNSTIRRPYACSNVSA